jgi:KaiC/GvpD/RAD55 family RecA-like ATPase
MIAANASSLEVNDVEQLEPGVNREEAFEAEPLNLVSKFLESPGNVLLVQGSPGTGKTTLALELLRKMRGTRMGLHTVSATKVYVSSRVSPIRLRRHFPGIHEVIDSMSGKGVASSWTGREDDAPLSGAANIADRILSLKRAKQKGIVIIDSWEGAVRAATEDERRSLESAIFTELDESKLSAVLVSETDGVSDLAHLVDGVATLSSSQLEDRVLRSIAVDKLRGFRLQTQRAFFSLDGGRFMVLPRVEFHLGPDEPANIKVPEPIPNSDVAFSTGSPDLDKLLQGGVKRGASVLIDLDSSVSPRVGGLLLYIITANCINQGGCAFIMPYSIFSSQNVAESLMPFIGRAALDERVRIAEYNQALPDEKWRVKLKGKMQEDFPIFSRCWNQLGAISNSRMLKFDFDKFAQIYGEEPGVPGVFEIGAGVRDSAAFMIGVASRPSPLREEFQRSVDYFLKMQSNGSLLIYGVKPFTNVHGVEFSFERGYPKLSLMEIV